ASTDFESGSQPRSAKAKKARPAYQRTLAKPGKLLRLAQAEERVKWEAQFSVLGFQFSVWLYQLATSSLGTSVLICALASGLGVSFAVPWWHSFALARLAFSWAAWQRPRHTIGAAALRA